MWKDYSIGFIKKNRASSVSVLVAAFISALFLSLLCGLFYNFWNYEIESVVLEEGNWQGRISGALEEDELSEIENFANVKTVAINEDLSDEQTLVVDICFDDMRAVYQDMPLIAQQLGVPETSVSYHESLLSSYFINDPQNSNPPLLMAFYLFVLLLVSVSLILIIHNSFADTGANSYLSFTGSGDALCTSYIARKFCRNRFDFRGHPSSQYPRRWYCRQA